MKANTKKKDNTFLYIISTITFVLLGIILTAVIRQNKPNDIRTRASATSGIDATATVTAIDSETHSMMVKDLIFTSSNDKNLGTWQVTPPLSFTLSSLIPGNSITLKINPSNFDIQTHTLTAKEIKKK